MASVLKLMHDGHAYLDHPPVIHLKIIQYHNGTYYACSYKFFTTHGDFPRGTTFANADIVVTA